MSRLIFLFALSLLSANINAQPSWKWGISGGCPFNTFGFNDEHVIDIACDKDGNTYAIALVHSASIVVDGNTVPAWGVRDVLLTSFDCDGAYRWSKVIGSADLNDDGAAVGVDTLGGVYVFGRIQITQSMPGHFGPDTLVNSPAKSLFLVKFNSSGIFQWLRRPQADTVSVTNYMSHPVDMNVTPGGDVRLLCSLAPGAHLDGTYVVSSQTMHLLHYNAAGTLQGAMEMDMQVTGVPLSSLKMARDNTSGRYYLSGTGDTFFGTVFIGGVGVPSNMYVASFSQSGQHLWTQKGVLSGNGVPGFSGRPVIDDSGYIYVGGTTSLGDTFANSYVAVNTFGVPGHSLPFIAKLDSNANLLWATNASASLSTSKAYATLITNDEIVLAASYGAEMEWPGYAGPHPHHASLQGYDLSVTRFNTHTGEVIGIDTASSHFGAYEMPSAIVNDGKGGVVIGGYFDSSIFVADDTLIITGSDEPDFIIARYGESCNALHSSVWEKKDNAISVFPNPATGYITVTSNVQLQEIFITNTLGQTVLHQHTESQKTTLNIDHLQPGIYFVSVTDVNGNKKIEKFIKQ